MCRGVSKYLGQIEIDSREDGLGFRIAQSAVEFKHLGAGCSKHQAKVEKSLVGNAVRRQSPDCRLDDKAEDRFAHGGGEQFVARVGTHAAGVWTLVAVE